MVSGGALSEGAGGLVVRLSPISLRASERVRLGRIWPRAVYKEDVGQIVGPMRRGASPAVALAELLGALVPPEAS